MAPTDKPLVWFAVGSQDTAVLEGGEDTGWVPPSETSEGGSDFRCHTLER